MSFFVVGHQSWLMLRILDPGILTTIQDTGRWGFQIYGVPVSGAMDVGALRTANQLVGNAPDAAALEIHSPVALQTDTPHLLALTGAEARFEINGYAMPSWMSIFTRAGAIIEIAPKRAGGWLYLAIHGGIDVPRVLGSRSTFVRGQFGGLEGRALAPGDYIPIGAQTSGDLAALAGRCVRAPAYQSTIRVILGPHDDWFTPEAITALTSTAYTLTETADRMGYRLRGCTLPRKRTQELISCGIPLGAIQVPPDGQPIILMADHQTAGGYPIIATVISEDIAHVAQSVPGDRLTFRVVEIDECAL